MALNFYALCEKIRTDYDATLLEVYPALKELFISVVKEHVKKSDLNPLSHVILNLEKEIRYPWIYLHELLGYSFDYFNLILNDDDYWRYYEYVEYGNGKALGKEIESIIEKYGPSNNTTFSKLVSAFQKDKLNRNSLTMHTIYIICYGMCLIVLV